MKDGVGEWRVWIEVVTTDEVRGGQAGRVLSFGRTALSSRQPLVQWNDVEAR